jgi:outer membrane PBP1 activator LpoA protein
MLKAKKSKLSAALCAAMTVCALTLGGCGTTEDQSQASVSQAFGHLDRSVDEYSSMADAAGEDSRFNALILLARSQIAVGNADGARQAIASMESEAQNQMEKDEATIINGLLLARTGNNEAASATLAKVGSAALPESAARYYHVLNFSVNEKAFAKTKKQSYADLAFSSGKQLVQLTSGEDRLTVLRRTVALLDSEGSARIASGASAGGDDAPYYEYAAIDSSSSDQAKSQLFSQFAQKYPDHPLTALIGADGLAAGSSAASAAAQSEAEPVGDNGGEAVPANVTGVFKIAPDARVAVLLPLSGRFAQAVGMPAKLGVMAALQQRHSDLRVTFYDTAAHSVSSIAQEIKGNGTALVIGPLLKPDVAEFNAQGLNIPSIVLNTTEGARPANQWHFDLSPDYEGALAASKAASDGVKKAVVIYTQGRSQERAANGFLRNFQSRGGSATQCAIADAANAAQAVKSCSVQGADAAYVAGSTADAVNIRAGLPSNLKVYLTDGSFEGFNNSGQQLALKGTMLGDMPWLLSDSTLKQTFMKSIPKANPQAQRVFCAGYDAVSLALLMPQLAKDSKDVLHGLTGDISLGQNGLVETAPMWVELGKLRQ